MKEWKGTIEGWGSFLNVLTTFISFHLRRGPLVTRNDIAQNVTNNDRTRAAVVVVFDRCTSFTASLVSSAPSNTLGRHNQTLPQFPKPI